MTIFFPPRGVCDFCSAPAAYIEEADDSQVDIVGLSHGEPVDTGLTGMSAGDQGRDWASCTTCHRLIQQGQRLTLVQRAVRSAAANQADVKAALAHGTLTQADLTTSIWRMHTTFWNARTGGYHAVPR